MPQPLRSILPLLAVAALALVAASPAAAQDPPLRVFISVDMEGLGGVGTPEMVRTGGKDYATGRRMATDEVNAVVQAVFAVDPGARILVNDSHGDMQNLLHTELDPRVEYIQGAIKKNGMMEGLDASYDGVVFLGYHSMAGTTRGFLAHTGSGVVKGLWINGTEVGEGGMNALYAGSMEVPVVLASGDLAFVEEFSRLVETETVVTKEATTPRSARLRHPDRVTADLREATARGLAARNRISPLRPASPVEIRIRFDEPTRPQILTVIPGVRQVDGYTVEFTAETMAEAYPMIRLMYRFVGI
jgi:D-amino peptidase